MVQEPLDSLLVIDTNVIISLIQAGELSLLKQIKGYKAVIPDEVIEAVTNADQAAVLSQALRDGFIVREPVAGVAELESFADFIGQMGRGEAACHLISIPKDQISLTNEGILEISNYKQSLALAEKSLGAENSHVVDIVGSLATLYDSKGERAAAKPLFKRYLKNVETTLGLSATDPKRLITLKAFAKSLRKGSQIGNADLVEKAIQYEAAESSAPNEPN